MIGVKRQDDTHVRRDWRYDNFILTTTCPAICGIGTIAAHRFHIEAIYFAPIISYVKSMPSCVQMEISGRPRLRGTVTL